MLDPTPLELCTVLSLLQCTAKSGCKISSVSFLDCIREAGQLTNERQLPLGEYIERKAAQPP